MGASRPGGDSWADDVRRRSRLQWSRDPAGALVVDDAELGTSGGFRRIEAHRDAEQPWMDETFRWPRFAGRRVLEVGVGLGTDHVKLARAGARLTGIDLTPECASLTARRLELEGFEPDLRVMDAEDLQFGDGSFDAVYSFGVLHHVPHPERAFAEIRRVLRPGGELTGGLYNLHSIAYAIRRARRATHADWRHEPLERTLARIEHTRGEPAAYVRLFTAGEVRRMLHVAGFARVDIVKRHAGLGRHTARVPATVERSLGALAGWYLVPRAIAA